MSNGLRHDAQAVQIHRYTAGDGRSGAIHNTGFDRRAGGNEKVSRNWSRGSFHPRGGDERGPENIGGSKTSHEGDARAIGYPVPFEKAGTPPREIKQAKTIETGAGGDERKIPVSFS